MPLYQYKCSCGYEFEAIQKIKDREHAACKNPKGCLGVGKRQLTAPAGIVNGYLDSGKMYVRK